MNYGDGSGSQALTLDGKTFQLSHAYASAGTFAVGVTVSDGEASGAATATVVHIKRYRSALIEAKYNPITIRWKLSIVRRFYEAARNAGLRPDNPAAGVKSARVRQATEDFK